MPQMDELRRIFVMGLLALILSIVIAGGNIACLAQEGAEPGKAAQTTTAPDADRAKDTASPGQRDEEKLTPDTGDIPEDRDLDKGAKELQEQKDNLFIQWFFVSVAVVLAVIALAIWMSMPPGKKKGTSA